MLILEIALGIVLAVLILAFWRQILGLGFLAAIVLMLLGLGGLVVYWATTHFGEVQVVLLASSSFAVAIGIAALLSRMAGLSLGKIDLADIVVAGIAIGCVTGYVIYLASGRFPAQLWYLLPSLGIVTAAAAMATTQVFKRKRFNTGKKDIHGPNP